MHILTGVLLYLLSPEQGLECRPIDTTRLHAYVDLAIDNNNTTVGDNALGELIQYWKSHCKSIRKRANSDVLRELSRLLPVPELRYNAAVMLVDIGPRLRSARTAIRTALNDEIKYERDTLGPIYPSDGFATSNSLRCLLGKIDTGRLERRYCFVVLDTSNRPN